MDTSQPIDRSSGPSQVVHDNLDIDMAETDNLLLLDLAKVSFDAKWDLLKPRLERLYLRDQKPLKVITHTMKVDFNLNASERVYKYHFKKWGWEKSLSASNKRFICNSLQTRAGLGKLTDAYHMGQPVSLGVLRRFVKDTTRQITKNGLPLPTDPKGSSARHSRLLQGEVEEDVIWKRLTGSAAVLGNSIFLNWNLPFHSMLLYGGKAKMYPSPPTPRPSTLVVSLRSPSGSPVIRNTMLSPVLKDHKTMLSLERTKMFIEGNHFALTKSLTPSERRFMSEWLYQFWYFSFKTAKYWGRGPRTWTADMLFHNAFQASTPRSLSASPIIGHSSTSSSRKKTLLSPPTICRYSMHCEEDQVIREEDFLLSTNESIPDPQDESTWSDWSERGEKFPEKLCGGLVSNEFSDVDTNALPIDHSRIAKVVGSSDKVFEAEAAGFAIISRNWELLDTVSNDCLKNQANFYPLHLATSFLDGARSCCLIVNTLMLKGCSAADRNNLGYTVLDNLFLTILRSHTTMQPSDIDVRLRGEIRLPGEEVDICGRWDADSDCYRNLLAQGIHRVPNEWKHKFCHNSAKTICDCITSIHLFVDFDLYLQSGLFSEICEHCGLNIKMRHLHALVIVAFNLAEYGMQEEDLFGIIAVALCLIRGGIDLRVEAPAPFYLLENDSNSAELSVSDICSHLELTAFQMASHVLSRKSCQWSPRIQRGWKILCFVLKPALSDDEIQDGDTLSEAGVESLHCSGHSEFLEWIHGKSDVGILIGAVQAELLTYRRLSDTDPWISENFDLDLVLSSFENNRRMSVGRLTDDKMLRDYCTCGRLGEWAPPFLSCDPENICSFHFMNLDQRWDLLSILPPRDYEV